MATYKDLCIDANNARSLGEFWAAALGRELRVHDDDQVLLTGPTKQHTIWVNTVPEPVSVKQRVTKRMRELVSRCSRGLGQVPT